jgi:hypothetical protein
MVKDSQIYNKFFPIVNTKDKNFGFSPSKLVAEKPGFGQGLIFIFILIIVIAICVTIYFVVSGKFNKSASEEKSQITYWT